VLKIDPPPLATSPVTMCQQSVWKARCAEITMVAFFISLSLSLLFSLAPNPLLPPTHTHSRQSSQNLFPGETIGPNLWVRWGEAFIFELHLNSMFICDVSVWCK